MVDLEHIRPTLLELVADLRVLREKGLGRLSRLDLPALTTAAQLTGDLHPGTEASVAVENLLGRAVADLGDGAAGRVAVALMGLRPDLRGANPTDLRREAARVWGITADSFRKDPERSVIDQIAQQIAANIDEKHNRPGQVAALNSVVGYHGTSLAAAKVILGDVVDPQPI